MDDRRALGGHIAHDGDPGNQREVGKEGLDRRSQHSVHTMTQPDASPEETSAPAAPSDMGAKLFVIFFFAIVPLLGIALLAIVIYSLLMR